MSIVYRITNIVNHKVYIGVTENFDKRCREHLCAAKIVAKPLYRAMRKYGIENFLFEVIAEGDRDLEMSYITEYRSKNPKYGYNLTDGGEGTVGYSPSLEARQKMREAKLGRKLTNEHKQKIKAKHIGTKRSDETKAKIAKKLLNNKNFAGKTFTDEVKQHLSALKSKTWSLVTPDGEEIFVTNLRKFCLENNLSPSAMSRVMNGSQSHHKGYKAT